MRSLIVFLLLFMLFQLSLGNEQKVKKDKSKFEEEFQIDSEDNDVSINDIDSEIVRKKKKVIKEIEIKKISKKSKRKPVKQKFVSKKKLLSVNSGTANSKVVKKDKLLTQNDSTFNTKKDKIKDSSIASNKRFEKKQVSPKKVKKTSIWDRVLTVYKKTEKQALKVYKKAEKKVVEWSKRFFNKLKL